MKIYGERTNAELFELSCEILQKGDTQLSFGQLVAKAEYESPPEMVRLKAELTKRGSLLVSSVRELLLTHIEYGDAATLKIEPGLTDMDEGDVYLGYLFNRIKALAPTG